MRTATRKTVGKKVQTGDTMAAKERHKTITTRSQSKSSGTLRARTNYPPLYLQRPASRNRVGPKHKTQYKSPETTRTLVQQAPSNFDKIMGCYGWNLSDLLGQGSFGKVYKGTKYKVSGTEPVAVKVLSIKQVKSQSQVLSLLNEIAVQNLSEKCQNIVKLHDTAMQLADDAFYIFLEYCDGDVEQYMERSAQTNGLSETIVKRILSQLMAGMQVLVQQNFIHRDIKPANILFKNLVSGQRVYKIADFGFATVIGINDQATLMEQVGSPFYESPQILQGMPYTAKTDIWSIGATIYEILFGLGQMPWPARSVEQLLNNLKTNPQLQIPADKPISADLEDFLRQCLQAEEGKRIGWDTIFQHPVLQPKKGGPKQILKAIKRSKALQSPNCQHVLAEIQKEVVKEGISYEEFFEKIETDQANTILPDELYRFLIKQRIPVLYCQVKALYAAFYDEGEGLSGNLLQEVLIDTKYWSAPSRAQRILLDLQTAVPAHQIGDLFYEIAQEEVDQISIDVVKAYLQRVFPGLRPQEMDEILQHIDLSKNGAITLGELYIALCGKGFIASLRREILKQIRRNPSLTLKLISLDKNRSDMGKLREILETEHFHQLEIDFIVEHFEKKAEGKMPTYFARKLTQNQDDE